MYMPRPCLMPAMRYAGRTLCRGPGPASPGGGRRRLARRRASAPHMARPAATSAGAASAAGAAVAALSLGVTSYSGYASASALVYRRRRRHCRRRVATSAAHVRQMSTSAVPWRPLRPDLPTAALPGGGRRTRRRYQDDVADSRGT